VEQIDAHMDWRDEVRGERMGWSADAPRLGDAVDPPHGPGRPARHGSAGCARGGRRPRVGSRIVTAQEVHRHGIAPVLDWWSAGEAAW
jgi:agmatinase